MSKKTAKEKLNHVKYIIRLIVGGLTKAIRDEFELSIITAVLLWAALNYIASRVYNAIEKRLLGAIPEDAMDKPPSLENATSDSEKNASKEKSKLARPKA